MLTVDLVFFSDVLGVTVLVLLGLVLAADDAWHETQATSMTSPPPLRP